ncbi:MAG: hypothetical protein ACI970_001694 [Myxococcota bacterium]
MSNRVLTSLRGVRSSAKADSNAVFPTVSVLLTAAPASSSALTDASDWGARADHAISGMPF